MASDGTKVGGRQENLSGALTLFLRVLLTLKKPIDVRRPFETSLFFLNDWLHGQSGRNSLSGEGGLPSEGDTALQRIKKRICVPRCWSSLIEGHGLQEDQDKDRRPTFLFLEETGARRKLKHTCVNAHARNSLATRMRRRPSQSDEVGRSSPWVQFVRIREALATKTKAWDTWQRVHVLPPSHI